MNEVTRIHLGRQPFMISVEAHRALKQYLHEIQAQVSDKEVVNEVELRMAELLTERGISTEKVVLPEDIDFLQQQLGLASDFSDDSEISAATPVDSTVSKRLYRDIDHGLIAGVAAGLASYFGLEAALVRIIFVVLTLLTGGVAVVLYAVLWLTVPAAETLSDKLQMRGKSVTLESLKDSVNKADLPGSAQRVSISIMTAINKLFAIGIKLLGIGFIITGLAVIVGIVTVKSYMLLHHGQLFQENLFPVGVREQWLVDIIMVLMVLVAVFLMLIGIASLKRKWPIKSWATGVLAGLFLLALAATFALSADIAPQVRDRYEESLHTTAIHNIQPFDSVTSNGSVDLSYISSPTYAVDLHYSGQPDLSKIKITVKNNVLHIDSTAFDNSKNCTMLCLFPRYDMTVEIYAPNISSFNTPPNIDKFYPAPPPSPQFN